MHVPVTPRLLSLSPISPRQVHACFEGDTAALETLRANGCNLRQKFEWVLQEEPLFSLVHAAAFNGQEKVHRRLRSPTHPGLQPPCTRLAAPTPLGCGPMPVSVLRCLHERGSPHAPLARALGAALPTRVLPALLLP